MAQINKPTDYFNTVLWSGDSTSSRNITGVGFQPDWVWQKCRSHAVPHLIYDSVRTAGNDKELCSNDTAAEGGQSAETDGYMSAFISDGFTVAQGTGGTHYVNLSGRTYAAWNWLAGGTASSNTDGNLTSQVSANTTSGFSIVSWTTDGTNNTVGHGLGQTPSIVIAKNRSNTSNFDIITNVIDGSLDYLKLNLTDAKSDLTGYTLNSSVFSLTYTSGSNAIAYCFAEKKGYSKFGSFNGNGSADGTFVYTGFKPAFIITKLSSGTGSWFLHDNKRNGYNGGNNYVYPNASDAELTTQLLDITSNGFKMRFAGGANSSGTSIYMAFAESPLVGTNNIPATAR